MKNLWQFVKHEANVKLFQQYQQYDYEDDTLFEERDSSDIIRNDECYNNDKSWDSDR
jgi:hypothetical protein